MQRFLEIFGKASEKVRRFMLGRNGIDKLTVCLLIIYLLLNGIKMFFRFVPVVYFIMWGIALIILGLAIFRTLSKNCYRRQYENGKFLDFMNSIHFDEIAANFRRRFNRAKTRVMQFGTHRFRTCPKCHEHLRMSKKRGKRNITCPKCGHKFKVFIPF